MTLTVCGSYARLRIILHGAHFDDKTQWVLVFFIGMEVLQSTVLMWEFDFFLQVDRYSI